MNRTDAEWALFGKRVPVGTRIKWRIGMGDGDEWIYGTLLENYPHLEKAQIAEQRKDPYWTNFNFGENLLQVDWDETAISPRGSGGGLFDYMYYLIDDEWLCFDDVLMMEDEIDFETQYARHPDDD